MASLFPYSLHRKGSILPKLSEKSFCFCLLLPLPGFCMILFVINYPWLWLWAPACIRCRGVPTRRWSQCCAGCRGGRGRRSSAAPGHSGTRPVYSTVQYITVQYSTGPGPWGHWSRRWGSPCSAYLVNAVKVQAEALHQFLQTRISFKYYIGRKMGDLQGQWRLEEMVDNPG